MNSHSIFISYRRNPCVEFARTIHYALLKFGIDSFFDYTSCRDGHFNEKIYDAIDVCKYVFLIIMDGSLDDMADNPTDWVRTELEYAVDKGKTIVPIVKANHTRKWPDKLPEKLEQLRTVQISKIDDEELFEVSLQQVLQDRTSLISGGNYATHTNGTTKGILDFGVKASTKFVNSVVENIIPFGSVTKDIYGFVKHNIGKKS